MEQKKERRKKLGEVLKKLCALCLCIILGLGICTSGSVNAETLTAEERTTHGDVTLEDLRMSFNEQRTKMRATGTSEPQIQLEKTAKWIDIEEGLAELTITERDTEGSSNVPVDYIFILDRTRTMSLNESTFDGKDGLVSFQASNSPCINPEHYYYNGGIYLKLKDYFTGYDYINGIWYENLSDDAELWNCHHNSNGEKIIPTYENGCQDRLTMAKQAISELVDQVEAENEFLTVNEEKSRIAFWSFGDSFYRPTGDMRELGLYNYTPWTADYDAVRDAVASVKTYSGTYYVESLKEAYRMITTRNREDEDRKNRYTKVVFLSDGECTTDVDQVLQYSDQIKALPNTELFTLAIGMTADSSGTRLLQQMASGDSYTASFWQTLSFDGGKGSVLSDTLMQINGKGSEVHAVNKVLTDQIETEYWEPIKVISASGGAERVQLEKENGMLTWHVPEGANETYSCTVQLKLKDSYRYLLSDTHYPTNRDAEGATSEAGAGAVLTYTVSGGAGKGKERSVGVLTPTLKYGTVCVAGEKIWTVAGAEGENVTVNLVRRHVNEEWSLMNSQIVGAETEWRFDFQVRDVGEGKHYPLIKYDEHGNTLDYEVKEAQLPYYKQLPTLEEEGEICLYNEPYKAKIQIKKVDEETGNPLQGAMFSVYAWSCEEGKYIPYFSTTDAKGVPYETGTVSVGDEALVLDEVERGCYETTAWVYYTPDNQGKFQVIETSAPGGYYGDWKNQEGGFEETDKNVYEFQISGDPGENGNTLVLPEEKKVENKRVTGRITYTKVDADTRMPLAQGEADLSGATYRLYAAEDIRHQDGTTGILYHKDEEIKVRKMNFVEGTNSYCWDAEGSDLLTVGSSLSVTVEGLELGSYYLQEAGAGEGYLINPDKSYFEIAYQDEKTREVVVDDYHVCDQVMKQTLTFCKVEEKDGNGVLSGLSGAGFSIYPIRQWSEIDAYEMSDSELIQYFVDTYRNPETLSYEIPEEYKRVTLYKEGEAYACPEIFSDGDGMVTTPELPYGSYIIVETTVPEEKLSVRPFVIHVDGDAQDGQVEGDGLGAPLEDKILLLDKTMLSYLRVEKVDAWKNETVIKPGAAYVIHDIDKAWFAYRTADMTTLEKMAYQFLYGDLVVQYENGEMTGTREFPYVTKETREGVYMETPEELPPGRYELEEVEAPDGYVLAGYEGVIAKDPERQPGNHTFYEREADGKWHKTPQGRTLFVISSDEAKYDSKTGTFLVSVKQKNTPAVGKISIYAEGEMLQSVHWPEGLFTDYDIPKSCEFRYEYKPLQGVTFEIRAAEDLYEPEGTGTLLYAKGDLVAKLVTNEQGKSWTGQEDWEGTDIAQGLPLGKYLVTPVGAELDYSVGEEAGLTMEVELAYAGQEIPVVYRDLSIRMKRKERQVEIEKIDRDTKEPLAGAVFGLYTAQEIKNADGKLLVGKDVLLETIVSDENGKAVFGCDLPKSSYYVKELKSPNGYQMNAAHSLIEIKEELFDETLTFYVENERLLEPAYPVERTTPPRLVHPVKTGDSFPIYFARCLGLLLTAGLGITIGCWKRRR